MCSNSEEDEIENKRRVLAKKIHAVAKIAHFYKAQREDKETVLKLKGMG